MKDIKLKLAKGKITALKKEKSKINPLQNIDTLITGTAYIGMLAGSTSLLANAPIMILASKGREGITFIGDLNNIDIIGQFTAFYVEENTDVIAIISEEAIDGRHLVYAILDPKDGLLYMIYEMGRSIKKGYKAILKQILAFSIFCWGVIFIVMFIFFIFDGNYELLDYKYLASVALLSLLGSFIFFTLMNYFSYYKSYKEFGFVSEKIFEKLGFKNPEDIDLYPTIPIDRAGYPVGVFEYRKVVENDPYPSDYFDKKEE
nr:putative type VI secretion system effector [Acinetobacter sp. Marseille-Q1620]